MDKKFTDPKTSTTGKIWFVWFRYYDDKQSKWRLLKFTGNANKKGLTKAQKRAELTATYDLWKYKLNEQYYNPLTKLYEPPGTQINFNDLRAMNFLQALEFAKEKKSVNWAKKSLQESQSVIKYLSQSAHSIGIANQLVVDVRRSDYKQLLETAQANRKLSGKGFNKYRRHLSGLIGELIQWDILDANPVAHIKTKQTIKTFAHRPPTETEREKIVSKLKTDHYNFYRFCATLYGTTIRKSEILALQVKDIFIDESLIRIVPDKSRGNSKVSTEREIVIPDTLRKLFIELNLTAFKPTDHVFSKHYLPGSHRMHPNTPTHNWFDIVKKELGINKDLYSLKKLSGNDMIDLQVSVKEMLKLPQKQMGHTTSEMTEVYVTRHREIMKDLIKNSMPEL